MPRIMRTPTYLPILTVLFVLLLAAPALAGLELSEILADPTWDWNGDGEVHFRDDEWVEVTNTGPGSVDLTGYYLRDGTGEEAHLNLFGILAEGEAAVFYGHHAVAWQTEVQLPISGLSLNNAGDLVELWQGDPVWPGSVLIDSYEYSDHEAEDDRSSGRLHPGGVWALFDGLYPYGGNEEPLGTLCEPSPGVVNACQPLVPVSARSWGGLKAAYR
jgi:hypothetical protein